MRLPSVDSTSAPSIFDSSRSRVGANRDVQREAAVAYRLDALVVAEHDQRAGAATQDALEAVAQRGAGSQPPQRLPQRGMDQRRLGVLAAVRDVTAMAASWAAQRAHGGVAR